MSFVHKSSHKNIVLSLAKTCAVTLFVYFFMVVLVFIHGKNYTFINSPWGYWYLVEIIGFVLVPCVVFIYGYRYQNLFIVRAASVIAIIGIILNRLNISTIAFQWYDKTVHYPTWMEIVVCIAVIFVQVFVFRWIIRRMPVYKESPGWVNEEKQNKSINLYEKRRKKWKVSVE